MKRVVAFVCFILAGLGICLAESCFLLALSLMITAVVIAAVAYHGEYKKKEVENNDVETHRLH